VNVCNESNDLFRIDLTTRKFIKIKIFYAKKST
jgi:hypothetical protein